MPKPLGCFVCFVEAKVGVGDFRFIVVEEGGCDGWVYGLFSIREVDIRINMSDSELSVAVF